MGLRDSLNNLASPTNIRQNLQTLTPSENAREHSIIQPCSFASSFGLPENSDFKSDQFNNIKGPAPGIAGYTGDKGEQLGMQEEPLVVQVIVLVELLVLLCQLEGLGVLLVAFVLEELVVHHQPC